MRAEQTHERAATLHDEASRFFEEHGDPGRASRERRQADHERQAAVLEHRLSEEHKGQAPDAPTSRRVRKSPGASGT